jgi:hypothetical protein
MLRLTPRRSQRVPYGLAIFSAFLLAASVFAGAGRSIPAARQQAGIQQTAEASARDARIAAQLEAGNPVREAAVTKTRKFRVNLFLFRH